MTVATSYSVELRDASDVPNSLHGAMLLWTDPPYGTGKVQSRGVHSYNDPTSTQYVNDAIVKWLPTMADDGTLCVCLDYRNSTLLINAVRRAGWVYRGEIIWEFGLGRPRTSWWPVRHNSILTFTKTEFSGLFDDSAVPRTKRLSPKPGYPSDKPSGSVWDFTMNNTHSQRVGYPNQKPLEIIEPFILAHTRAGDLVIDPFCGSSSTGEAAIRNHRTYFGCDTNPAAVEISLDRLAEIS